MILENYFAASCYHTSYMMEAKDQQGPIIGGVWETARKLTMHGCVCACMKRARCGKSPTGPERKKA